jgi:hypothetical protein
LLKAFQPGTEAQSGWTTACQGLFRAQKTSAGRQNNRLQTVLGKGWCTILRLFSPPADRVNGCEVDLKPNTTTKKEENMVKRFCLLTLALVLVCAGVARAQEYPVMNMIAEKVIQKYQASSCEDLWKKKGKAKGQREQEVIQLLRGDPRMRQAFIDKVAPPIANKMFECGMIP